MTIRRSLMLLGALVLLLGSFTYLKPQNAIDRAYFGGDTWFYHAVGVNLSRGHGYVSGAMEPFNTYKFGVSLKEKKTATSNVVNRYRSFHENRGAFSYYSAPGYALFLGAIYSIFGVSPQKAKQANILLLSLTAALLPLIGARLGRVQGYLAGFIASMLFIKYFIPNPFEIMTEPLIVFGLALWALAFIFWERKPTRARTALLGISFGLLYLIKGLMIFCPLLFAIYCVIRFRWQRQTMILILIFAGTAILTFSPWSIYGSLQEKRIVILAGKSQNLILDGNNEDGFATGSWMSRWRNEPNDMRYFYNRMQNKDAPAALKVMAFWKRNLSKLPSFFWKKLQAAFYTNGIVLTVLSLILYYLFYFFKQLPGDTPSVFPLIYLVNLCLISVILFGYNRFTLVFMPFFLLIACYMPFSIFQHARYRFAHKSQGSLK